MLTPRMDQNARVLVVDDNDEFRATVSAVLEGEGYDVVSAASGPAALATLDGGPPPDLILIDLTMPGMSGAELVRELGRHGEVSSFGLVAMSCELSASASPARWFLKKPLDMDLLLATVGELCPLAHTDRVQTPVPQPAPRRSWSPFFRARTA